MFPGPNTVTVLFDCGKCEEGECEGGECEGGECEEV